MEIEPKSFNQLVAHAMMDGLSYEEAVAFLDGTLIGQMARLRDVLEFTIKTFETVLRDLR